VFQSIRLDLLQLFFNVFPTKCHHVNEPYPNLNNNSTIFSNLFNQRVSRRTTTAHYSSKMSNAVSIYEPYYTINNVRMCHLWNWLCFGTQILHWISSGDPARLFTV